MEFKEKLKVRSEKAGISLNDVQLRQFELFYHFLIDKNRYMNLTAITEEDQVIEKHFIDSLSVVRTIDFKTVNHCIDVGTGAGFPGIPLKILYPDINFVLIDSLAKRIKFIDNLIQELGLKKIKAFHGRAEDFGRNKRFREKFDLCLSRAVANLSVLSEYCIPFLNKDGYFISYKSMKGSWEMEEAKHSIHLLGACIEGSDQFQLDDGSDRLLIKIKKLKKTDMKYPRKAGIPAKNPL